MKIEFNFSSSKASDGQAVYTTANRWSLDPRASSVPRWTWSRQL